MNCCTSAVARLTISPITITSASVLRAANGHHRRFSKAGARENPIRFVRGKIGSKRCRCNLIWVSSFSRLFTVERTRENWRESRVFSPWGGSGGVQLDGAGGSGIDHRAIQLLVGKTIRPCSINSTGVSDRTAFPCAKGQTQKALPCASRRSP